MVNLWSTTEHALDYLARADRIPHRTEGEATLLDLVPQTVDCCRSGSQPGGFLPDYGRQDRRQAVRILDLGTGDGRLLALLKIDRPHTKAVALDFSPVMLEKAKDRFKDDNSIEIIAHNLDSPLPALGKFDAIVSSFAIHHVSDDRKRSLYAEIFDLLNPGGTFANLEHVSSPTEKTHRYFLSKIGYTPEQEDPSNKLLDVDTQLGFLRSIGFEDVDCYWKWLEMALIVGIKPQDP